MCACAISPASARVRVSCLGVPQAGSSSRSSRWPRVASGCKSATAPPHACQQQSPISAQSNQYATWCPQQLGIRRTSPGFNTTIRSSSYGYGTGTGTSEAAPAPTVAAAPVEKPVTVRSLSEEDQASCDCREAGWMAGIRCVEFITESGGSSSSVLRPARWKKMFAPTVRVQT